MNRSEIIDKISEHLKTRGGAPGEWFIGISQNVETRLFVNHRVDKENDKWIFIPTNSGQEAKEIRDYFINSMGIDSRPGGDNEAKMIYAYKKAPHTEP